MNDILAEYYTDSSRVVTPQESMQNLVAAVVLRGVLDYRENLIQNVQAGGQGYYIKANSVQIEAERFFRDINFMSYIRLPAGVIAFREKMDEILRKGINRASREDVFRCPICRGIVDAKRIKVPQREQFMVPYKERWKFACRGCLIKMEVPIMEDKQNALRFTY